MTEWGRVSVGALILGAVVAVGTIAVVFGGEAAISRTEFCVSCHSETFPYEELKKSSHYGALGADPGCKDCHVPQGFKNFHHVRPYGKRKVCQSLWHMAILAPWICTECPPVRGFL